MTLLTPQLLNLWVLQNLHYCQSPHCRPQCVYQIIYPLPTSHVCFHNKSRSFSSNLTMLEEETSQHNMETPVKYGHKTLCTLSPSLPILPPLASSLCPTAHLLECQVWDSEFVYNRLFSKGRRRVPALREQGQDDL